MTQTFEVFMSGPAEQDLIEIARHVAAYASKVAAERLIGGLLDCVSTLERFPSRGSVPAELADMGISDFRQLIFQAYRMVYRVVGDSVFVVMVADGRRDMQQLLERRLLSR